MNISPHKGFTLLELLIVIGILAVLSAVTILIINPTNLMQQSRDTKRITDLSALDRALRYLQIASPNISLGSSSYVYISLADSSTNCPTYVASLPPLPAGQSYYCVTLANLQKIDSTGWIPVDFSQMTGGSAISSLPIDPTNNTTYYYTYTPGGSFKLTSMLENTTKHDAAISDGGSMPGIYEVGTDLKLEPSNRDMGLVGYWRFDEGTGVTTVDSSGKGNTGTLTNGPSWQTSASCKQGGCLLFDGSNDWVSIARQPPYSFSNITLSAWFKTTTTTLQIIASRGWGGGNALYTTSAFTFYVYNGSGCATTAGSLSLNTWYLITGTADDQNIQKLYLNGALLGTRACAYCPLGLIGSISAWDDSYGASGPFSGWIDEVRVYNRALSQAEIQAIYNATK